MDMQRLSSHHLGSLCGLCHVKYLPLDVSSAAHGLREIHAKDDVSFEASRKTAIKLYQGVRPCQQPQPILVDRRDPSALQTQNLAISPVGNAAGPEEYCGTQGN